MSSNEIMGFKKGILNFNFKEYIKITLKKLIKPKFLFHK
ncbi:hypothetical protein I600_3176 [Maribacter dokdonensis DSW-8]|nr:hypothetical protein I600_3176 [Maribacter dokdonensis DSW-8]